MTVMVLDLGRNAHQAIEKARQYINEGYTWVVVLTWRNILIRSIMINSIALVAREVKDKRVLKLIRAYLNLRSND